MKDSVVMKAADEEAAPRPAGVELGPLISNFGALLATPEAAPVTVPSAAAGASGARPAMGNSVEHFQLKQALQRAKQAGVPMRDVAQMVALTFAGK